VIELGITEKVNTTNFEIQIQTCRTARKGHKQKIIPNSTRNN